MHKQEIAERYHLYPKDIYKCKIWFHLAGRTPVNVQPIYQIDFYVANQKQEVTHIDTGFFNLSAEEQLELAAYLKEHAVSMIDPFHILPQLSLSREECYSYLDQLYHKREYQRIYGTKE